MLNETKNEIKGKEHMNNWQEKQIKQFKQRLAQLPTDLQA